MAILTLYLLFVSFPSPELEIHHIKACLSAWEIVSFPFFFILLSKLIVFFFFSKVDAGEGQISSFILFFFPELKKKAPARAHGFDLISP